MIRAEDAVKGACLKDMYTFLLCLLDLLKIGGKLYAFFAESQRHILGAEPYGGAGAVKGHIAAAHDDDTLAHPGILTHGCPAQEIAAQQDAGQVVAGHFQAVAFMSTYGDEYRVIILKQFCRLYHAAIALHMHTDFVEIGGFFRNYLARETVGRNAIGHLSAEGRIGFL